MEQIYIHLQILRKKIAVISIVFFEWIFWIYIYASVEISVTWKAIDQILILITFRIIYSHNNEYNS